MKYKRIRYNYDFGDDWWFTIKLEKVVDDYYLGYPALLDRAEAAPPEDVGGLGGFYAFLDRYFNPEHPDYEDTREWGGGFDYIEYDPVAIDRRLKAIDYQKKDWERVKDVYLEIFKDKYANTKK